MRELRWCAVVIAACGGGGAKPAAPKGAECPAPDELAETLRAEWKLPPEQKVETSCTAGSFPEPGWAVSAVVDETDESAYERSVVIASGDRHVIAATEAAPIAPWFRGEGGGVIRYRAIDFDGDGTDELTSADTVHHGGTYEGRYVVVGVAAAALVELHSVVTESGNDAGAAEDPADEYSCKVEVEVTEPDGAGVRRLVVTGAPAGDPGAARGECPTGRTEQVLRGGRFEPAP